MLPTRILPGTSLQVSPLCLGVADLGVKMTEPEGHALLDAFTAAGGNFIDTARIYSDWVPGEIGRSERVLGDWLVRQPRREALVIATKGAHPPMQAMAQSRLGEEDLRHDIEASLRALRTDYIDLYWLHRDDPQTPVEAIVDRLNGFAREGKIRYFAASNWKPSRLRAANAHAARTGLAGFVASQILWNLASRHMKPFADPTLAIMDAEALAFHRETRLPVVPYSSQANGFFCKLAKAGAKAPEAMQWNPYYNPYTVDTAAYIEQLARPRGLTPTTIALAYLLLQDLPCFPIIGPGKPAQLADSLRAAEVRLDASEIAELERRAGIEASTTR